MLFKSGNANRAEAVNGYLELTRNASAPTARDVVMQPGETVYIIENQFAQNPGGWATQRIYTNLNEARRELALLPEYKNLVEREPIEGVTQIDDIVIRECSVKQPLPSRQGIAGPQTSPDGGLSYPGGGKQVEFLIDTRKSTLDPRPKTHSGKVILKGATNTGLAIRRCKPHRSSEFLNHEHHAEYLLSNQRWRIDSKI